MVVCLFAAVLTVVGATVLTRSELLEASCLDRIEFLVLPSVCHNFIRVRAHELALQTVEVRCLVLR